MLKDRYLYNMRLIYLSMGPRTVIELDFMRSRPDILET